MAAVALFMVGRLAKFNDIFTSTVPTINNFSNHALKINCLTLFVQLKIQNNILFLYTTAAINTLSVVGFDKNNVIGIANSETMHRTRVRYTRHLIENSLA